MWERILKRIWGDQQGWAHLMVSFGDQKRNRSFQYPGQLGLLMEEIEKMRPWADIYFMPHLSSSRVTRQEKNYMPSLVAWVDKDEGSYDDLTPRPTICWETSSGRYQAVWVLDEPVDADTLKAINKHLNRTTKADKGTWNIGRLLRVPGTLNHKRDEVEEGNLMWDNGPTYSVADLLPSEEEVKEQEKAELEKPLPKRLLPLSDILLAYGSRIPSLAWKLLNAAPDRETEDWSRKLWNLERLLFEADLPPEHVFVIAKHSPWNKYEADNRNDGQLWKDVLKAQRDRSPIDVEEDQEELPWMSLDDLLVYVDEPKWLVENIWMGRNVGWIAGVGKSYKSVLSLDLALSVALDTPFLGQYPVVDSGPVLMVQEEDPAWRVARRAQVICEQKGIENIKMVRTPEGGISLRANRVNIPFFISIGGGFVFTDEDKTKALERAIDRHRPKLVVLDPMFMMSAGVDEYKAGEITDILLQLKNWRNKYDCAIAIVHHYRKGNGSSVDRIYGSMALYAWSENNLLVGRKRGANISVIETDIKDAPAGQQIIVDFIDIKDNYTIRVIEEDDGMVDIGQIKAFLASGGTGSVYTVKDIKEATGISDKTIRHHLKDMEDENRVQLRKGGKGGRGGMFTVTPTDKLLKDVEDQEVIFE